MAAHPDDAQHTIPFFQQAGFTVRPHKNRFTWGILGFTAQLKKLHLVKNKHIPTEYLWGSIKQRLALLQGLMDTDGTCDRYGKAEFCNTNKNIALGAYHLAASLGLKPYWRESPGVLHLNGVRKQCKLAYFVAWTSPLPVFRLKRKLAKLPKVVRATQQWRYITKIEPTGQLEEMRCITVANPTGLYLFGNNFNVTHNSLASASIAALCTRGAALPASKLPNPVIDVLMLIGEDDPDDTAVPRLIAAGADMKRVHFLESVKPVKSEHREIRLDMDIPAIEGVLAANPSIGLLIIDPISNYLGEVNMIAEQEVRSILIPLKRAAEKHNIAVLVIMHLNKKTDLDAISRVGGAMAFIGVARCSWLFVRDVREEEMEGDPEADAERPKSPDSFSMLRIKNNLVSSSRAGLAYCVSTQQVEIEGTEVHIPYVAWGGIIEGSADEALGGAARRRGERAEPGEHRGMGRPNVELQRAIKWLSDALQDGQARPVKILKADAQGEMNVSPRTLMRAWGAIGAKSVQIRGIWHWQIDPMHAVREPGDEDQTPQQGELMMAEGAVE